MGKPSKSIGSSECSAKFQRNNNFQTHTHKHLKNHSTCGNNALCCTCYVIFQDPFTHGPLPQVSICSIPNNRALSLFAIFIMLYPVHPMYSKYKAGLSCFITVNLYSVANRIINLQSCMVYTVSHFSGKLVMLSHWMYHIIPHYISSLYVCEALCRKAALFCRFLL